MNLTFPAILAAALIASPAAFAQNSNYQGTTSKPGASFQKDDTTSVPKAARKIWPAAKSITRNTRKKCAAWYGQFIKSCCFHYEGRRNAEIAIADFWRGRAVRVTGAAAPLFVRFE